MATTKQTKQRWSEMEDDDAEDLSYLLPPKEVIGPDKNGIKKVIEYKFNEEGKKVKVTTTSRVKKVAVSKRMERIMERRSNWAKFGDAVGDDGKDNRLTMVSTEEIFLERPKPAGSQAEESKAGGDTLAQQGKVGGAVLMVCRACGKKGDHWTARCPYKDLAPSNGTIDKPATSETAVSGGGFGKARYVLPSKRGGADQRSGTDMRRNRDNENSVRVSNLSEDTREADLRDLFEVFGRVSRAHVVADKQSGISMGFGFVNFVNKEDAERAIKKLNGHGYDNLILSVGWANPRTN